MPLPPRPPRHMIASALRASASAADAAAQTPDASADMGQDADSMTQQLCCPKCGYCGTEDEFQSQDDGGAPTDAPDSDPGYEG